MSAAPTATHCPYCALQCGIRVVGGPAGMAISGNLAFPVNKGALCVKGWSAAEPIGHPDRLQTPLVRNAEGRLEPASWDDALELVARRFSEIQARYGHDAVGVFGGGATPCGALQVDFSVSTGCNAIGLSIFR